ncbi:EthD domain-containing protein [Sphingomonas sp. IC081]|uniref:EthD domain-containing protein n=1 Tax=Sphingomonas sp. IC081 TaxID=304378 RepID=UPI00115AC2CF|nr:EthD domain-containing protein [Sphingomonas sp. IC081]QDK33524.1 ethyl tert-butyl ether degradation protein EthD [Sphingomonas sp. IC081]
MEPKTYKILLFMKRRADLTPQQFRDYYETRHAPLAVRHARGLSRYVRRYLEPQVHPETGAFTDGPDVITELWFEDEAVFRGALRYMTTSLMPADIVADEANLFDRTSLRIAAVTECESDLVP